MKTVLVVDDHRGALTAYKKALADDYKVIAASDPYVALEILKADKHSAHPDSRISLLLTDLHMSGINGYRLIYEADKIRKGMAKILCTGGGNKQKIMAELEVLARQGIPVTYVEKPPVDLLAAIEKLIGR
ncbi:response regulator [Candidatus Woesearchaeota archaeon]|nr:response regulator [Candidatus Woesearchaeota archaeon]